MATKPELDRSEARSSFWVSHMKDLGYSLLLSQGVRLEVEYLGHKLVPVFDASTTGGR